MIIHRTRLSKELGPGDDAATRNPPPPPPPCSPPQGVTKKKYRSYTVRKKAERQEGSLH